MDSHEKLSRNPKGGNVDMAKKMKKEAAEEAAVVEVVAETQVPVEEPSKAEKGKRTMTETETALFQMIKQLERQNQDLVKKIDQDNIVSLQRHNELAGFLKQQQEQRQAAPQVTHIPPATAEETAMQKAFLERLTAPPVPQVVYRDSGSSSDTDWIPPALAGLAVGGLAVAAAFYIFGD